MMTDFEKLPRIYTPQDLKQGEAAPLSAAQAHYLKSVMRRNDGETIRVFNGCNGEWAAELEDLKKKSGNVIPKKQLKDQPKQTTSLHLFFTPVKKHRLDIIIEKSVELGVTDFHPIITEHTEVRTLKIERMTAQIIEAAEQCERMDMPKLYDIKPLSAVANDTIPIFAALERTDSPFIATQTPPKDTGYLIGPVGGFTDSEKQFLENLANITPVSLGERVYRVETAVVLCLSHAALHQKNT